MSGYTVTRPNPRRRLWEITAPDGRVVHTAADELQALSIAGHMTTLADQHARRARIAAYRTKSATARATRTLTDDVPRATCPCGALDCIDTYHPVWHPYGPAVTKPRPQAGYSPSGHYVGLSSDDLLYDAE